MNNKELEYIYAAIDDDIDMAIRQHIPINTNFFNLAEQSYIEKKLSGANDVKYLKAGGYKGAERCVFTIYSAFIDYDVSYYIPIKVLKITWNRAYYNIGHRDILGSILGLGIKREIVGDIIVEEDIAYAFVIEDMANYIIQNLARVGNATVTVKALDIDEVDIEAPEPKVIESVVSSLRLDCIVGAGFGLSRNKGTSLIKAGRVMLNWQVCTKPAEGIEPGDTITIRGRGRIRYKSINRKTRKNRLAIIIERYV